METTSKRIVEPKTSGSVSVGQLAPDFRLRGPAGQWVSLADHRGQPVVLVFYPLAFTPICSQELPDLERAREALEALEAVVLGVSVDSWQANEVFARQIGVRFPLLSDFHREVSRAYGVLDEERFTSRRATFVLDRDGVVVHAEVAHDSESRGEVPSLERIRAVLERLRR